MRNHTCIQHVLGYIEYAKRKGCSMQGTADIAVEHLNVLK